jgi:hypothetical protein
MEQLAKKRNARLINLRLSQIDNVDLRGNPYLKKVDNSGEIIDVTGWAIPEFFVFEKDREIIIFLDEFNRAQEDVLQASIQLLYERKLGSLVLPDNVKLVAAGNIGEEDNTIVYDLDAAFHSRFVFIQAEAIFTNWLTWAKENKINSYIIDFLSSGNSRYFYQTGSVNQKSFACPRTWEILSKLIDSEMKKNKNNDLLKTSLDISKILGTGIIGSAALAFISFLETKNKITPRDIIENYDTVKNKITKIKLTADKTQGIVESISVEIFEYVNDKNSEKYFVNVFNFLNKHCEKEHIASFLQMIQSSESDKVIDVFLFFSNKFKKISEEMGKITSNN